MAKRAKVPVPMEALLAAKLPEGDGWQYEPKWDGFRCIARREGDSIEMISRSGKPLGRYFPEVLEMLSRIKEKSFTLDGELIIPLGDRLDFEALQMRLHPAESRVRKLSAETPAQFMLFDVLQVGSKTFDEEPLSKAARCARTFLQIQPSRRPAALTRIDRPRRGARLAEAERRST